MEQQPQQQSATSSEVDIFALMDKQLPSYVVNCLRAAGFDELEVIASMDITDGEENSINKIERYIEKRQKNNPEMLPPCCTPESMNSLPFEFPPGHRIRICKFVDEIKQLNKNMSHKAVSQRTKQCTTTNKTKLTDKAANQVLLSVNDVYCQVLESLKEWIHRAKLTHLNSLKEKTHYSVTVKDQNHGQIAALVNCIMCRKSICLQLVNNRFILSNWTKHVKKCAARHNVNDPSQPTLFSKQLEAASKSLTEATVATTNSSLVLLNNQPEQVFH